MPAKSIAQRKAMAIAEHHPEELYSENKGMAKMSGPQLHEFASTKEKGMPEHVKHKKHHAHKKEEHGGRSANPRGGKGY